MKQDDLTSKQKDYAIFLPAISTFYSTYIGKQRFEEYVDEKRIPAGWDNGMESINFFNKEKSLFPYKWALYSAGHANLDVRKDVPKEDMTRNRDRENTFLLGDSGGFQIAKGIWEGEWTNPNCPKAMPKRKAVVEWLDAYMDYGMMLDIPTWTFRDKDAAKATGIHTYDDAVTATHINAKYYMDNRKGYKNGGCKVLNVLQGGTHKEADNWYEMFKEYCDPAKYPDTHFDGWGMGGQNMCDIHLILERIVTMHFDGLLEEGVHDWMHFLGTSKLEWAVMLTDIQRAVRENYNPAFTISFDCASPFLATANGQVYHYIDVEHKGKWSYRMNPSIDDKALATSTISFKDAFENKYLTIDKKDVMIFEDSPVTDQCGAKDICWYKPGDLNKIGKEGKTSWDSFSYTIQMAHNVWTHIAAVQQANVEYDKGNKPGMLILNHKIKKPNKSENNFTSLFEVDETEIEHHDDSFRSIVNSIFAASTKEEAVKIIESNNALWKQVIGSRGASGKNATNASTMSEIHFDYED